MIPARQLATAALVLLALCFILFTLHRRQPASSALQPGPVFQSILDPSFLAPTVGTQHFRYLRRYLHAHQTDKPDNRSLPARSDAFNLTFTTTTTLATLPPAYRLPPAAELSHTLDIPAPRWRGGNPASLMFGLASTVPRLEANYEHLRHWLAHTGVRVFASVPRDPDFERLRRVWRELGIDLALKEDERPWPRRMLGLVADMNAHAKTLDGPPVQWFGLAHDDTFFPSVRRLVAMLAAYNANRPFYVGGLAEPKQQLCEAGLMGYGGAGVFLSKGLVTQLLPHVGRCLNSEHEREDEKIAACVFEHSSAQLTVERELHQFDLPGPADGVYESGFKPLSLHHWRGGQTEVPMDKVALVKEITGDEGLFQRWRWADDVVLTNGFSLVKYEQPDRDEVAYDGEQEIDFRKTEFTWSPKAGANEDYKHTLGPLRDKVKKERKSSWRFADSVVDHGAVRQLYVKQPSKKLKTIMEVVELIWLPD